MTSTPLLALTLALFSSFAGQTRAPSLRGIGFEERLDEAAVLDVPSGLPVYVRLAVPRESVEPSPGALTFERLDARLARLASVEILLTLEDPPGRVEDVASFASYAEGVARRYASRVRAYVLPSGDGDEADDALFAYTLKLVSVQIGAADPDALLLASGSAAREPRRLESLYDEGIAPYVDGWVMPQAEGERYVPLDGARAVLAARDPGARVVVGRADLDPSSAQTLRETLGNLAAGIPLTLFEGPPARVRSMLELAREIEDVLTHEVVTLDEGERDVRFEGPAGGISHRLFYDPEASSTYLFYWKEHAEADANDDAVTISLEVFSPEAPVLRDPVGEGPARIEDFRYDAETRRSHARVTLARRPLLLQIVEPATSASVVARADLSVEEIIARYRETERRQTFRVESYLASAVDEIHFRPNPTDPGFDVSVRGRYFHGRDSVELEELSFSVNGATWGSDRPAFPLLQPEKVLSLPLELNPEEDYAYRLLGRGGIGGHDCYVIEVEPARTSEDRALFRGRIWIDVGSFRKRRLELVQTNLASLVVSNEEVHTYEQVGSDADRVFLLTRSSRKQIVLLAGRNLLVERETRYSDFEINPPDFLDRRRSAHRSNHIMMRDTEDGMRYLVKRGGERVLSDELTPKAKALAMGTHIDPSFDYPLPVLGLNYLDFDFMEKDAQLALLFGGVLAFGNLQKPRAFGTPIDVSFDFFGIAVRSDDKVFDENGEDETREIRRLPGSVGLNLGWQLTPFQKVTGSYELRYDVFAPGARTSEAFVVPSDTVTGSISLRYEYQRRGYALTASGSHSRRARWEPWGDVARFDPATRSYAKYSVTLAKDFFFEPLQKLHFDVGFFGGERLDRFSRYQFGLFDPTRIHGLPATALRFEELFLARAAYAFNLFDVYRFDLFFDQALGDDPSGVSEHVRLTGVGTALNFRGPWSTIVRLELGKSFLPARFRGAGSVTSQVLILKPL